MSHPEERLEFILLKSLWEGGVIRQELMERFDIGSTQATKDFREVKKDYPDAIHYEASQKKYIPLAIEKYIGKSSFKRYLDVIGVQKNILQLNNIQSSIPIETFRSIHLAISQGFGLEFSYLSLNSTDKKHKRGGYPHSLINSGWRWHIRCWEKSSGLFKDFNIPRIKGDIEVILELQPDSDIRNDQAWFNTKHVFLIPNPGLSKEQKEIIEIDYGMTNGVLDVQCSEALYLYTMHNYLITDFDELPNLNQHLAVRIL
jgi:hypothetical protein